MSQYTEIKYSVLRFNSCKEIYPELRERIFFTCSSFIEFGLERPLPVGQRPELELKCAHWIN